jgi:hypothetical protein
VHGDGTIAQLLGYRARGVLVDVRDNHAAARGVEAPYAAGANSWTRDLRIITVHGFGLEAKKGRGLRS